MKKKLMNVALVGVLGLSMIGCDGNRKKDEASQTTNMEKKMEKKAYTKKYTNKDFYKDGKLQGDVALKAYEEMLAFYGIELSDFMRKNLWITDFELGDFEHVGMAGFFWVNDPQYKYFAHEIYLLPGQMITEHRHVATEYPAKMESWVVKQGNIYNYAVGEETPGGPALPEAQKPYITAKSFFVQNPGEISHLKELEAAHFMMAGDGGAVVYEFASYHDGNGLRFTNPNVEFTDILTKN